MTRPPGYWGVPEPDPSGAASAGQNPPHQVPQAQQPMPQGYAHPPAPQQGAYPQQQFASAPQPQQFVQQSPYPQQQFAQQQFASAPAQQQFQQFGQPGQFGPSQQIGYAPSRAQIRDPKPFVQPLVITGGVFVATVLMQAAFAGGGASSGATLTIYGLISMLQVIIVLAMWVLGGLWLHAAMCNAKAWAPAVVRYPQSYLCWVSWILPLVSFALPYVQVKSVWDAAVQVAGPSRSTTHIEEPQFTVWWASWLAFMLLNYMGSRGADTGAGWAPIAYVLAAGAGAGALWMWRGVLTGVSDLHSQVAWSRQA